MNAFIQSGRAAAIAVSAALALAACGGGGDDPAPDPGGGNTTPPHADNCTALQSGTYRIIAPYYSDLGSQNGKVTIDARTLAFTDTDGATQTWVANGTCRYTGDNTSANKMDVLVSPAGVLVARYAGDDGQYHLAFGFPEQSHTVSELAGTWNMLGTELSSGTSAATARYHGVAATATLSASGAMTDVQYCNDIQNCVAATPTISLKADSNGGFDAVDATDGSSSRCFAYQANGELMLACHDGDGSLHVWTRQRTNDVPAVGAVSANWGQWMNTGYVSTVGTSESSFTTTASDAAAGTWTRKSDIDGHLETLSANTPRAGYTHRPQGSATNSSGTTVTVAEFTSLNLKGMGVSVLWLPGIGLGDAPGAYFFSVQKP